MKISDYIVEFIEQQQVKVVFGYAGGMITHLMDSLTLNDNVSFVQTYHEQSAAIAAEGYAIESKKCGVAIATSGPGATNMITGIADAYFDSIPVLYITGQVNTYEFKGNNKILSEGLRSLAGHMGMSKFTYFGGMGAVVGGIAAVGKAAWNAEQEVTLLNRQLIATGNYAHFKVGEFD